MSKNKRVHIINLNLKGKNKIELRTSLTQTKIIRCNFNLKISIVRKIIGEKLIYQEEHDIYN